MLTLGGEAMFGDAEQRLDGDIDADFFASFADRDGHGMRVGTYRSCLLIHFAS